MKFLLVYLLIVLNFQTFASTSQITVNLYINLNDRFPEQDNLFVTGNTKELCQWQTDCLQLNQIDKTTYFTSFKVDSDLEQIEVKFNRGSWDTQAAYTSGKILENTVIPLREKDFAGDYTIPENNVIEFTKGIVHWKDLKPLTSPEVNCQTFTLNTLDRSKEVCVWLPKSYSQNSKRYPVIYMFDGQNLFSADSSSSGIEWEVDENMEKLTSSNKIEEAIIVAIRSETKLRFAEYNYSKQGKDLSQFIVGTLIEHIDTKYRTINNRSSRYLMGSSMGALISFSILWTNSKYFSKAAALSLPAGIESGAIYQVLSLIKRPEYPIKVYIDHGLKGWDSGYDKYAKPFIEIMKRLGFGSDVITYQTFPYADHNEADWARRLGVPLTYLLGK